MSKGSVKDIYGVRNKAPYIFNYSDRYSVFDWGEMPDTLNDKGVSLAAMANFFFEYLGNKKNWVNWNPNIEEKNEFISIIEEFKRTGIKHHGLGIVDEHNEIIKNGAFSHSYAVRPMKIIRPEFNKEKNSYDYENYNQDLVDTLVPLEVIFRFNISDGSSLLKRAGDAEYLLSLGLTEPPKSGDKYELPLIEFSTKLESSDRYISFREAQEISAMSEDEMESLVNFTKVLALRLKDLFEEIGVELHDGKFEFAFSAFENGTRNFQLIDSIGPDELRLSYKGIQLSKECLRNLYRNSEWYLNVEKSKKIAKEKSLENWKDICLNELQSKPDKLPKHCVSTISMMYRTLTNALYGKFFDKHVFEKTWNLDQLVNELSSVMGEEQ